ncbi:uncharacterized protein LOC135225436 [Macrobrachium nipponense]|uniref:uncharacterized protein LOC135225436 n=1 Tax=Macrobrachium nipponense TaxID=159736 RepID=UPI0030C88503
MQLKKWFGLALVAVLLEVAMPTILLTSTAATATALTITVSNAALAAVGGAAVLLGLAGLLKTAGRGRGRRSEPTTSFTSDAVDILFAAAGSLDQESNCGLRLVCELAASPEGQLSADEMLILSLFGSELQLQPDQTTSPVTPFQLAAFLGRQSGNAQACATAYSKCKHNAKEIMDILRKNQA